MAPIRRRIRPWRFDVEADLTRVFVNGHVVAEVRQAAQESAGTVGLRLGADLDAHVTNVDVTLRLALPRTPASAP